MRGTAVPLARSMLRVLALLLPLLLLALLLALPSSAFIRGLEGREPRRGDPQPQWFTQLLDHFDGQEQRTWQQRYFINTQYWNPASPGPIFFQVGGEGAIGPDYVTELQMVNYGKKWGALMVALEHRFYGPSMPLPDLSTQNLRYLSSEQALADAAVFITWLKQQYNSPDVPVITFGCSYPGNLAAWFRLKYPHVTMASVASSSPVQATLDFYQYLDVVDKSLANFVGPQCDSLISQATTLINDMLATPGGKAKIEKMFNVCTPMQTDLDISTFYNNLMGNWMGVVQYNDENGNTVDMKYLCNIMESSPSSPLETYANISNLFLRLQGMSCMDNSYTDMITQLSNLTSPPTGVGARQWTYQTCTEFGYFQTTDSANQPFGSDVPLKYSLDMCNDLFGLGAGPNINGTNTIYGGNNFPAYTTSNILFVNGNVDPWHALGVTSAVSPSLPAILINGTAHCANVLPSRPDDPPSLQQARAQTQKQIDQWLTAAMGKKLHAAIN